MSPDELHRLRELADEAAFDEHSYYFRGSTSLLPPKNKERHIQPYETCPHPDCVLVRASAPSVEEPAKELPQWLNGRCWRCGHAHNAIIHHPPFTYEWCHAFEPFNAKLAPPAVEAQEP